MTYCIEGASNKLCMKIGNITIDCNGDVSVTTYIIISRDIYDVMSNINNINFYLLNKTCDIDSNDYLKLEGINLYEITKNYPYGFSTFNEFEENIIMVFHKTINLEDLLAKYAKKNNLNLTDEEESLIKYTNYGRKLISKKKKGITYKNSFGDIKFLF